MQAHVDASGLQAETAHEVSPRVAADIDVRKEEGIKEQVLGCWGIT